MIEKLISSELDFERRIATSRQLSLFRRNPSTWEFLLLLALHEGSSDDGMHGITEKIVTKYIGVSAMLKFMRERRDDGSLRFERHDKRSKWRIRLSDSLLSEVHTVIQEREQPRVGLIMEGQTLLE